MNQNDYSSRENNVIPQEMGAGNIDNEIDIRQLIYLLWEKKIIVLSVTVVFFIIGISYALLAKQIWTSQSLVTKASVTDISTLQLGIDKIKNSVAGVAGVAHESLIDTSSLSRDALYQDFITEYQSQNTKRAFLVDSGIFDKEKNKGNVIDARAQRILLSQLTERIMAKSADKQTTDMILTFSAETAEESKILLEEYTSFVQKRQEASKNAELQSILKNRIATLQLQYNSLKQNTLQNRQDEISRIKYSLRISQAAGVERPVENFNSQDMFSIELGSKGLEEKLKIMQEINDPDVLNQELSKIRLQLDTLNSISLGFTEFKSFSYIDSPEEPVSRDKPKRPLVVILAALLGLMVGVGIVLLQYALLSKSDGTIRAAC